MKTRELEDLTHEPLHEGRYVVGTVDDLEIEAFALSRNAEFMAYLDECRARGEREGGGVSLEEARRILGIQD